MTVAEIENEINLTIKENNKMYYAKKSHLEKHRNYSHKKNYYPHRMEEWYQEECNIIKMYDAHIKDILNRLKQLKKDLKAEEEMLEAAQSLLCLHKRAKKEAEKNRRQSGTPTVQRVRRSARFMDVPDWKRGRVQVELSEL